MLIEVKIVEDCGYFLYDVANEELMSMMAAEMTAEIDRDIINRLTAGS